MRNLALVVLLGCQQTAPTPAAAPIPAPIANVAATPGTPFVIHNLLVGEDGVVIRTLKDLTEYDVAVPDGPHRFKARDLIVDTAADSITKSSPPVLFETDGKGYKLSRHEPDGRERWSTGLTGVRSVRTPDVAVGGGRVVATIDTTIHAFDDTTGKPVWQANVEGDRLQIAGDTVYSTMCNEPTHDHWLIGTALADGTEKFRAPLAMGCDPYLTVANGLVIVVDERPAQTLIFDLAGHQLAKLDEQAEGMRDQLFGGSVQVGKALLLVTDKHLLAIDATGHVLWKRDHLSNTFVGGNQLVELPNGDVVIANYGAISDSGVDLIRIAHDGAVVWRSRAAALGVGHSEYEHYVYIEVRGDVLFVASQGSYGAYLEKLSVTTGARELRCVLSAGQNVAAGCTHPDPLR